MNWITNLFNREIMDHIILSSWPKKINTILINFVTAHVYDDARKSQTEREPGCLMCLRVILITDQKSRDQGQS